MTHCSYAYDTRGIANNSHTLQADLAAETQGSLEPLHYDAAVETGSWSVLRKLVWVRATNAGLASTHNTSRLVSQSANEWRSHPMLPSFDTMPNLATMLGMNG